MPAKNLPPEVRLFILDSVPSVPFVEALLLFHRRQAEALALADVANALYMSEADAEGLLDALLAGGFIRAEEPGVHATYRYAADGPRAGVIDQLAACYRAHLIALTHLIHDRTQRSATQFANAFRLRKDR